MVHFVADSMLLTKCRRGIAALLFIPFLSPVAVLANESTNDSASAAPTVAERLGRIFHEGSYDIYLTGYAWHDPSTYSHEKRAELNQLAWGFGLGKRFVDPQGHRDLLYAFAFLESHKKVQPIVGYARQWILPVAGPLSVGAGYTVGVTSRSDIFGGVPFPIALPVASLKWSRFSMMGTFIPRINGKANNGNVVFIWGRFELN